MEDGVAVTLMNPCENHPLGSAALHPQVFIAELRVDSETPRKLWGLPAPVAQGRGLWLSPDSWVA